MTLHYKNGDSITFNIFLILLGYSRLKYIELTLDRSQDILFKCMINVSTYFGGIPKEILFDNMKTAVDHAKSNYTETVLNESFYQFSKDFGFEAIICRPFKPQTKCKVEALARTMERLRPYDYEFESFDELEEIIRSFKTDLHNEISQAICETPLKLFDKEKEYLRHLHNNDIVRSYIDIKNVTRIVSRESLVIYDNRKYSVNPKYIGKIVSISICNDTLQIYFNKFVIKTHTITQKRFNYAKDDYINILKSNAMKTASSEDIEKMANINLAISNFPFIRKLSDFDFSYQPSIFKNQILDLASLRFIEAFENILFIGSSGVGKTHLVTSISIEASANHISVYFIHFQILIAKIKKSVSENKVEHFVKYYAKYKLLIIDELGYLPIDKVYASVFFN